MPAKQFKTNYARNQGYKEIKTCPKCKTKIGINRQQVTTETGKSIGVHCHICGYWKQL